jgi:mannose/fructose/N-acetylgalactosamine-specific phosphotransferase system component IIC
MKTLKILTVLFILFGYVSVATAQDSTLYKVKLEKFKSWQRSGKIIIISGAAITAIGGGIRVSAAMKKNNNPDWGDDGMCTASYIVMAAGIATMIPGIIYNRIGTSKAREYQIKLNDLRTGFYYTPDKVVGFSLAFKF